MLFLGLFGEGETIGGCPLASIAKPLLGKDWFIQHYGAKVDWLYEPNLQKWRLTYAPLQLYYAHHHINCKSFVLHD